MEQVLELLKNLDERIYTCKHCGGTGEEIKGLQNACNVCGGQGEVLIATAFITEIRELLETVTKEKRYA